MANKHDIQASIIELHAQRSRLGQKKAKLQGEISNFKEMLKVVKQGHETHGEIVGKKNALIADLNEIDLEIMRIKQDIRKRELLKEEVKEMEQPKAQLWEAEIMVLRDYYMQFAGDRSRIASLRQMSAEFASKLTKLLKDIK